MNPSTEFIPFARPSLGAEEEQAVLEVLRSGWLTTGKVSRAFEEEFAAFVGSPFALAVNSATSGLHLALEALGIGPGDKIVTTPYTFVSTAAVARHLGADLVFCDIAQDDYNMDPERLAALLARETGVKALVAVHVGGCPCNMVRLSELCKAHGLALVEDAAHAFPSRLPEGMAGTLGDIGVYSFYATKTITTGEGGMVVTKNPKLHKRMAIMRAHGFDRDAWDRYTSKSASWRYDVVEAGFKYNMPDILAAIGRQQLKKADLFLEQRKKIARAYVQAFALRPELENPPDHPAHSWHLFSLRLRKTRTMPERDVFFERLRSKGLGLSLHFIPLHTMSYWSKLYAFKAEDFPNAMDKFERSLSLPIWQGMSEASVARVIAAVNEVLDDMSRGLD